MIEFNDNKPIYRQITDHAHNLILAGAWVPGERVPSVRELAAELGVNTRTVMKAMDELQDNDIIIPRRGMGYTLAVDAQMKVMESLRREFLESTIPAILDRMRALKITPEELYHHICNATCTDT